MYKLITILSLSLLLTACTACSAHMSFDTGVGSGIAQSETKKGVILEVFADYEGSVEKTSYSY